MTDLFITIARFTHPFEAEILKSKLESEGVSAFIRNQHIVRMNWLYSNAVGGVELQVMGRDVARAREIMDTDVGAELEASDEFDRFEQGPGKNWPVCPHCGSKEVHFERFNLKLVFLSQLLTGLALALPFVKWKWKCGNCGNEWRRRMPKLDLPRWTS